MRDHGEALQAEQVGAAVGVRIEAGAHPARGRPDQEAAELAASASPRSPRGAASSSSLIVPSSSFSAMLPVKPSVTTTSAAPRSRSRLSALPAKLIAGVVAQQRVRLER